MRDKYLVQVSTAKFSRNYLDVSIMTCKVSLLHYKELHDLHGYVML